MGKKITKRRAKVYESDSPKSFGTVRGRRPVRNIYPFFDPVGLVEHPALKVADEIQMYVA